MLHDIKFETSALNVPKMTLKTKRSTLPHICNTRIPRFFNQFHYGHPIFELQTICSKGTRESQISLCSALRLALSKIFAIHFPHLPQC